MPNTQFDSTPISFVVTAGLIDALKSGNGGWSRDALALVGVKWPPKAGWKKKAVGRKIKCLQGSLDTALEHAERFKASARAFAQSSLTTSTEAER